MLVGSPAAIPKRYSRGCEATQTDTAPLPPAAADEAGTAEASDRLSAPAPMSTVPLSSSSSDSSAAPSSALMGPRREYQETDRSRIDETHRRRCECSNAMPLGCASPEARVRHCAGVEPVGASGMRQATMEPHRRRLNSSKAAPASSRPGVSRKLLKSREER
jgi:hypothetical protein